MRETDGGALQSEAAAGNEWWARRHRGVERPWSLHPDLTEALQRLLLSGWVRDRDPNRQLAPLVERYQEAVHAELISLLCHLRFIPAEAREHWEKVLELRRSMETRLGTTVDLRVVLVDYFLEVHRRLENPTVIEMNLFEKAREMAYRDELTGLHNFRYFQEFLHQEICRCAQYHDSGVSLAMIDLDDFKIYNDSLGHSAGNEVLACIGGLITGAVRKVDLAARYGGEEFAVVMPETAKLGACGVAERIRAAIAAHSFAGERRLPAGRLTATVGIAAHPADGATVEELVKRADQALYLAKSKGKNQVRLYGEDCRTFRRVRAELAGRLRYGDRESSLRTIDLSRGGVRLRTELGLPPGALIDVALRLSDDGGEVAFAGRVLQSSRCEKGGYEISVRNLDLGARARRRLSAALEEALRAVSAAS